MVGALKVLPHERIDLLIAIHQRPWRDLAVTEAVHRRLADDLPGQADAAAETFPVLLALQVVELDQRMLVRVGRADAYIAATFRFVRPGEHHEAMALDRFVAVVAHRRRQKVELNVRPAQTLLGANKTAGL